MNDELWMVHAVIQPFKLDAVSAALQHVAGFGGLTASECRGYGWGRLAPAGDAEGPPPDTGLAEYSEKLRVEVVVAGRDTAGRIVEAITQAAHTGRHGDGKIFVWPLASAVRIRTSEQGAAAIQGGTPGGAHA